MKIAEKYLDFNDVDGLAFAAARGKPQQFDQFTTRFPNYLGPLLELFHLSEDGLISYPEQLLHSNDTTLVVSNLRKMMGSWIAPYNQRIGFIRAIKEEPGYNSRLINFLMKAKQSGQKISGLSQNLSGQVVAAIQELENNIHEHSNAPETGVLAYKAEPKSFEFVVADHGIGILRSLRRCSSYVNLTDEGLALRTALTDGVSRHGSKCNRGYGFRPIFVGLVNLRAELRFRSGDHAITMDGTGPALATARIAEKAPIKGFFASVRCHTG